MFTGIIEDLGRLTLADRGHLQVASGEIASDAKLGDSIAINGVDLTLTGRDGELMRFDVMPETYRRSCLGDLAPGQSVNLERSVTPSTRLSGHIVRGVVEGTATLASVHAEEDAQVLRYRAPRELLDYVAVKGPICVDGASLTVIEKDADHFSVSLVRYTQMHTNHLCRRIGERVNIETDLIARYVALAQASARQP